MFTTILKYYVRKKLKRINVSRQFDFYAPQLCHLYSCVQIFAVEFQNTQDFRQSGYNLMMHAEGGTVPLILVLKGFSIFF